MSSPFDFDIKQLSDYLSNKIDDFKPLSSADKFAGGQSNPTFLLSSTNTKYVLRRKPPGKTLKGAHAVDREFRVLSALHGTNVPVAEPLHLCEDDSIIGSMFYVMEHVDGRVLWDPLLPELDKAERSQIYESMNDTLAKLYSIDVDSVGLETFGKKEAYFERQVHTWTQQYNASETSYIEEMAHLISWLPANTPAADGRYSIVHGDYRLDNLMFDKDSSNVIAILDWELSTIGHPFADLAYQCMQYYMPSGQRLPGIRNVDFDATGIHSEAQYIESYCQKMNIDKIDHWHFYLAFSLFRLAAICQGIEKRRLEGNASSKSASEYAKLVQPLADIAVTLTIKN